MARTRGLMAGLGLLVLAGHALVLDLFGPAWQAPSVLRPMATPMFTRELRSSAPLPSRMVAAPRLTRGTAARLPQGDSASARVPASIPASEADANQTPDTVAPPASAAASAPAGAATAATPQLPVPAPATAASTADAPASAANNADWPADTRLSYRVGGYYSGELHGRAQVQWLRSADSYQAQVEVSLGWLASFSMTSQGQLSAAGLLPQRYEEQVGTNRRHLQVQGRDLVLMSGERVPLPPGMQDTASQFVELTHRFETGRQRAQAGETVQLWLARPGGADLWTYDVLDDEPMYTARWGPLTVLHLVPRPLARPRGPITAEMWFAPALHHFPVRIKMNLGPDTWIDLVIEKIEQAAIAATP